MSIEPARDDKRGQKFEAETEAEATSIQGDFALVIPDVAFLWISAYMKRLLFCVKIFTCGAMLTPYLLSSFVHLFVRLSQVSVNCRLDCFSHSYPCCSFVHLSYVSVSPKQCVLEVWIL